MNTIGDILTICGVAVAGYLGWRWWQAAQGQGSPAPAPTPTPVVTPTVTWSPLQWILPSTAPDLTTQWQQNAAAANVGGINVNWSWDPVTDYTLLQQWSQSVFNSTGLRW